LLLIVQWSVISDYTEMVYLGCFGYVDGAGAKPYSELAVVSPAPQ
jgi:hypothetical protein